MNDSFSVRHLSDGELDQQSAVHDFRQARRKAAMEQIVSFLRGDSSELLSYEEVRKKLKARTSGSHRLQEIPLDAIVGSVGRYADFTRNFLPRMDEDERRWARVQAAAFSPTGVPPIEVYQIGDAYFVLDGNHRVSVARQSGAKYIEAYVTKIQTNVPFSPDIKPDELEVKAEYAEFLQDTRLDETRPEADLSMTESGKYRQLTRQIRDHRYFMGLEQQREISEAVAAADWYDTVYLPLAEIIRKHSILEEFPERTITDLYVWISRLRETAGQIGAPSAQNYVDEIQSNVADSPASRLEELIIQAEYVEFQERTRLDGSHPNADLRVTVPGKYRVLEEHIAVHRYFMGGDEQRDVSYEEAAAHWYEQVYLPVRHIIKERGILRDFPERSTTDLYLWLAEHQAELEKRLGWTLSPEQAADDLAKRLSPTTERFLARVGERLIDALTPDELESGPTPGEWRKKYWEARSDNRIFTSILVPLSGEQESWCALEQAIRFVKGKESYAKGSRLYGLTVIPPDNAAAAERAQMTKAVFEHRCRVDDIPGELAIITGKIARQICERAAWTDLVVIHLAHPPGELPIQKLQSGFRTILHRCSRPLLAVPGQPTDMEHALLAYDGSRKADEALFISVHLAGCHGVKLTIMAVTETDQITSENLALAKSYLRKHNVEAVYVNAPLGDYESVGDAILRTVTAHHCDHIIMGGYGRTAVLEIMLGSTVDYVLRESHVPVLICR